MGERRSEFQQNTSVKRKSEKDVDHVFLRFGKKWSTSSLVNLRKVNGVNKDSVKFSWSFYLVCCRCFDEKVLPKHIYAGCQVCRCHIILEATLNNHTYHCIKGTENANYLKCSNW